MKTELTEFLENLKSNKRNLTRQQYRTIKGCGLPVATSRKARSTDRAGRRDQALKGNVMDARKGLQKVLKRRCG